MRGISIRKSIGLLLLIAAFATGIFGHSFMIDAHAEEKSSTTADYYYKSVQIRYGDSLWSLADQHCPSMDRDVYVQQLKRINRLHSDKIHAGQYLTVAYYP